MQQQLRINENAFIITKLEENETVKAFDCGDEDLNDFVLNQCFYYRSEKPVF